MISFKDVFKMIGIIIVSFCAVFVCTLFLNYNLDLAGIKDQMTVEPLKSFYDALVMTGKMVSALSGGCLLLTTVVLLCFYIGHYIDIHKKELGILKALGYSRIRIAKNFSVFGLSVFTGTALGFACAYLLMPKFYEMQNEEGLLPDMEIGFSPLLLFLLVILPACFFALLAIFYSYLKLKLPTLELLRDKTFAKVKTGGKNSNLPFLQELKRNNLKQRKSLVFFITFAVFCFSAMMQMSFSMDELSSEMMAVMTMLIGITLACVTLFIATTSVIKAGGKTIAMMKVFGYDEKDCFHVVLGGYRPFAYLGFALGTGYQYGLLRIAVTIVFANVANVPDYRFDVKAMAVTLALFVVLYESVMYFYTKKMKVLSLKEIMLD